MPPLSPLRQVAFTLSSTYKFFAAAKKVGIIGEDSSPKILAGAVPTLARYRFTTARELEQSTKLAPERNALIDDDGVLTYRELSTQAKTLARWMVDLKKRRGFDTLRIGVMARNGRGAILPMAAKGYAGAELYMLNVGSSPEQLAGIFRENGVNVLFIDDEFADRLPADTSGLTVVWAHTSRDHSGEAIEETMQSIVERGAEGLPTLPRFPRHGSIVLMSSGTTGVPKGIHRNEPILPFVVGGYLNTVPWRTKMNLQVTASMFHSWGWSVVNIALAARNTVITQRVFDPENVFRQIEEFGCEGLISSPIFLKKMLEVPDNDNWDTSSLAFIASAGNALTPVLVERMHERFGPILANFYGSTELALAACATAEMVAEQPTVAGTIPPGTILRIYDDEGNEVPRGETGRIFLTNETTLTRYSDPNMKIVKHNGLVEIGDLGYFDEKGYLHVQSRNDDMIIVGGENVHPVSVVETLERMPGIYEVHAGGVDDAETFKRIAVWVVRTDDEAGRALTADAIRAWVNDNLADHSVPRDVNFVDSLPRNATGKVVARHLPPSTRED